MKPKKTTKPKACQDCPPHCHCGETALYSKNKEMLDNVGKNGVVGYDVAYLANVSTKQLFMFGNAASLCPKEYPWADGRVLHEKAYQQALKGKMAVYEWSMDQRGKTVYFQSTLIPLLGDDGQAGNVLGLVKNITPWAGEAKEDCLTLREGTARTFSQILLAAREEEKKSISKALHDEIGTAAVVLTALLSMVKDSVSEGKKRQALQDIEKLDLNLKQSIERVKNIIVNLWPQHLESVGLKGAADDLLSNISAYSGLKYKLITDGEDEVPVSDNVKIVLYRVIQESLNNVMKHSHAKHVRVEIHTQADQIHLKISDDGIGFKPSRQRSIRQVGLLAMKDSIAYLGGLFCIKSQPGQGTVIDVSCPRVIYDGGKRK